MYCTSCGTTVPAEANFCMNCGEKPNYGTSYCPNCAGRINEFQAVCLSCSISLDRVLMRDATAEKFTENRQHFCRSCGNSVDEVGEYCLNCGKKPLNGHAYCQNCSANTTEEQEICIECGVKLQSPFNIGSKPHDDEYHPILYLNEYHRNEYQKIEASQEQYKGAWNWAAFFFGPLWLLSKGIWQLSIIMFAISFIFYPAAYLLTLLYAVIIARRGNYLYYRYVKYNEQLPSDSSQIFKFYSLYLYC